MQPTRTEKLLTLQGCETGWDYRFTTPPVPHNLWTLDDWINYIGDNWFRKP